MTELQRHVGQDTDIPAGDIGVGGREIGFLFGQYKRLRNEFTGTLTGKGMGWGGSPLRPEATGYGVCYFAQEMLSTRGESFQGKTVVISGSGNVAQYAVPKGHSTGSQSRHPVRLLGLHLRPDGHRRRKTGIRSGIEKYFPRPDSRICGTLSRSDLL